MVTAPVGQPTTGAVALPASVAGTGGSYSVPAAPVAQAEVPVAAGRSRGAGAAVAVACAVIGVAVAGVWWTHRAHLPTTAAAPTTTASPSSAPVDSADMEVVLDAKRLSDQGKYDAAHQRLAQLAPGSEARQSADFKDVEFKWATETLLLADRTPDLAAKRALLEVVAQNTSVDETVRASARDRLAALDSPGDGGGAKPAKVPQTTLRAATARPADGVVVVTTQPDTPAPVSTFVPVAPPTPSAAPQKTVQELANSTVSADWWIARRILEPKVSGGTATVEEIHLLSQICKDQHDKPCMKMCARALKR